MANIIKTWLAPNGWRHKGQFHVPPRRGSPAPAALRAAGAASVEGRKVIGSSCALGSYGMGGPGFVGLELAAGGGRKYEWLVLCLWGAEDWVLINDESPNDGPQAPQVSCLVGKVLENAAVEDKWSNMSFSDGSVLEIPRDPRSRPRRQDGSLHILNRAESLLDAWVLSPSDQLYV